MGQSDFERQLRGDRLTTLDLLYHLPDHPGVLQRFLWQTLDEAPNFPRIYRFLDYWRREIDAVIHSGAICAAGIVIPARVEVARIVGVLH